MSAHRIVHALVATSQLFDRLCLPEHFRLDGNTAFIGEFPERYLRPGSIVADVGSGKNPAVSKSLKRGLRLTVVGMDISADELSRAPSGIYDRTIRTDIAAYSGPERVNAVICCALLEHVRDTGAAMRTIAGLLRPGGVALLFVPCRNAVSARMNLLLPEKLKRWMLHAIYGDFTEVAANMTGFRAYYDRCTPRGMRRLAELNGLRVERLQTYFASGYFWFLPPLYVAWRLWQILFRAVASDEAAETVRDGVAEAIRSHHTCMAHWFSHGCDRGRAVPACAPDTGSATARPAARGSHA